MKVMSHEHVKSVLASVGFLFEEKPMQDSVGREILPRVMVCTATRFAGLGGEPFIVGSSYDNPTLAPAARRSVCYAVKEYFDVTLTALLD